MQLTDEELVERRVNEDAKMEGITADGITRAHHDIFSGQMSLTMLDGTTKMLESAKNVWRIQDMLDASNNHSRESTMFGTRYEKTNAHN
jgi:hypothetical protein